MPITFSCTCGKMLRVKDELAGKRVKCPACAGVAAVPEPEPMFEVVDEPPPPPAPRPVARAAPAPEFEVVDEPAPARKGRPAEQGYSLDEDDAPKPAGARAKIVGKVRVLGTGSRGDRDEDADDDRPARRRRSVDEGDEDDRPRQRRRDVEDEDDDRPRKRKTKKVERKGGHFSFEKKATNSGVAGGLLAMVGAVVWLVVGLAFLDRFFIYPPILFVLGLISFIKGLASPDE